MMCEFFDLHQRLSCEAHIVHVETSSPNSSIAVFWPVPFALFILLLQWPFILHFI